MLLVLRVRPCPTSCSGPRPFYVLSSRVGLSSSRPGGAVGGTLAAGGSKSCRDVLIGPRGGDGAREEETRSSDSQ